MKLEDRVIRLEQQNRWMKRSGAVLVLILLAAMVAQREVQPEEITVKRLLVTDEMTASNITLLRDLELRHSPEQPVIGGINGESGFWFYGPHGRAMVTVGYSTGVVGVQVWDAMKNRRYPIPDVRAELAISPNDGAARLWIKDDRDLSHRLPPKKGDRLPPKNGD